MSQGRKTKNGKNSTAAPTKANGRSMIMANQKNAKTTMFAANWDAIQVSEDGRENTTQLTF